MSKEYTTDEVREKFLKMVAARANYWDSLEGMSSKEKLHGLAFSIMSILDGCTDLPGFIVAPIPHESDKDFLKNAGENYYPENHENKINCDIAGCLHELYHQFENSN